MSTKTNWSIKLTENISLSECKDGFWLYDYTRGMNLSMRAKTEREAFVEAITYYQKRLKEVETKRTNLFESIEAFINDVNDEED